MEKLSTEMTIEEIILAYPETLPVFENNGFKTAIKAGLLKQAVGGIKLSTILKARQINPGLFLSLLEEKIEESRNSMSYLLDDDSDIQKLDFLGHMVCPLRQTFKDGLEETLSKYHQRTGKRLACFVPSGCEGRHAYEDIWQVNDIDDFPSLVMAVGFGDCFRGSFVERFVRKGYFQTIPQTRINPDFASIGCTDPAGFYSVFSVFPHVMLVDKKKLGDLPLPKSWADLLDPIYAGQIITHGSRENILDVLLLYTFRDHGEEGLRKLAYNIKDAWHPSKMAKMAGTVSSEGAAIYIIPWFFANTCPRTDVTEIIWPLEGAMTSPMVLLVKANKIDELKPITDFITGADYGKNSADRFFPVLNPDVDNHVPEDAHLQWLGWDILRSQPVDRLQEYTARVFHEVWDKTLESLEQTA